MSQTLGRTLFFNWWCSRSSRGSTPMLRGVTSKKDVLRFGGAATLEPGIGSEMIWMKMNNWLYASPGFPGGQGGQIRQAAICLGTGTIYSKKQYIITSLDKHVNSKKQYSQNMSVNMSIRLGNGKIYWKFALNPPKKLTYETFCWSERLLTQFALSAPLWNFSIFDKFFFGETR